MNYRGLKFRTSVRFPGGLDVWDEDRKQWFYTALVNDKEVLDYYLTEQEGRWDRTMTVGLFNLENLAVAGSLRFIY